MGADATKGQEASLECIVDTIMLVRSVLKKSTVKFVEFEYFILSKADLFKSSPKYRSKLGNHIHFHGARVNKFEHRQSICFAPSSNERRLVDRSM